MWHLPDDPDTRTTRQLVDPTMRELVEMQYQFEEPFVVDSSRIAGKLGVRATPLEQALADTLRSYRDD